MARNLRSKPYLKPSEVAELLRVEPGTVRVWAKTGRLRASITPGGHRRFAYRDVEAFARQHGLGLATREGAVLRVLVVDDDEKVAQLLARILASAADELELEMAYDGFEAGQMVEKFEPHVVLLDLFMPGVDGFELCKKLKSDPGTREIRVIAISGRLNPTAVERITELGAEACLEKPVDRAELFRVIGLRDSATDQAENHL